jgi:hypothetical protein
LIPETLPVAERKVFELRSASPLAVVKLFRRGRQLRLLATMKVLSQICGPAPRAMMMAANTQRDDLLGWGVLARGRFNSFSGLASHGRACHLNDHTSLHVAWMMTDEALHAAWMMTDEARLNDHTAPTARPGQPHRRLRRAAADRGARRAAGRDVRARVAMGSRVIKFLLKASRAIAVIEHVPMAVGT